MLEKLKQKNKLPLIKYYLLIADKSKQFKTSLQLIGKYSFGTSQQYLDEFY